jgi:hypothetical protein
MRLVYWVRLGHRLVVALLGRGFAGWRVRENFGLYGQVTKRIWWMPWQLEAMKDVVACDKPRGAGKQALIRGFPNGETRPF